MTHHHQLVCALLLGLALLMVGVSSAFSSASRGAAPASINKNTASLRRDDDDDAKLIIQGYEFASDVSSPLSFSDAIAGLEKEIVSQSSDPAVITKKAAQLFEQAERNLQLGELGEPIYNLYAAFWGTSKYVSRHAEELLKGQGLFEGIASNPMAIKAAAVALLRYGYTFQAMHHAMESAVTVECERAKSLSRARAQWDLASALYLGRGVDTTSPARISNTGSMLFKLSNELCRTSRTCSGTEDGIYGDSKNNDAVLGALKEGADVLSPANNAWSQDVCEQLRHRKTRIARQLVVPSLQLFLKAGYRLDPKNTSPAFYKDDERAVALVHAISVRPLLAACDPKAADQIYQNFRLMDRDRVNVHYLVLADVVATMLPCLKLDCGMLGGYTSYYVAEIEQCLDNDGETMPSVRASSSQQSHRPQETSRTANQAEDAVNSKDSTAEAFVELDGKRIELA